MPVSTGSSGHGEPRAKRCKHCDDSTHGADGPASWRLSLDQDLVDTLRTLYPDWFKSSSGGEDLNALNNNDTSAVDHNTSPATSTTTVLVGGGNGGPVTVSTVRQCPPRAALVVVASMADDGGQKRNGAATGAADARPPPLLVSPSRASPPKAVVDASPLQQAMDKNKESLKVKLLMRRPINQLVAQGIMPPLKTPPAFHEQRKQLERAKTGDLLKAKIQQRPDRQELERRHILEQQEGHVDPSLAERQRMLKKARLADQLNDQLSHRPGPLELIKKNILHTDEPIERAVKEGLVPFRATCEGQLTRPQHPSSYVTYDEDSQSSEGGVDVRSTPPRSVEPPPPPPIVTKTVTPAPIPTANFTFAELCQSVVCGPPSLLPLAPSPASSLSPLSSISSPPSTHSAAPVTPRPAAPSPLQPCHLKSDAPGKDKNRKKSKSNKNLPKARTIKFHEYKGPPSAQKSSALGAAQAAGETSYELLLQQQQLFLQWQLEWQHKYPQIILPASQKPITISNTEPISVASPQPVAIAVSSPASSSPPTSNTIEISMRPLSKLEDMKVSDLKLELKRRSLPVSGSKPQLIERLRPHLLSQSEVGSADTPAPPSVCSDESLHGENCEDISNHSPQNSLSPASEHEIMDMQADSPGSMCGRQTPLNSLAEDIVKEQQRKIEELQRELHKSQLQLQQIRQIPNNSNAQEPKNQKLALQQHLHNKIKSQKISMHLQQLQNLQAQQTKQQQENQQKQQKEHVAFQQGLSAKNQTNLLMAQKSLLNGVNFGTILTSPKGDNSVNVSNNTIPMQGKKNLGIVLNGQQAALVLNQLAFNKAKLMNGHHRTTSLPTLLLPANLLTAEQTNILTSQQNIPCETNVMAHEEIPTIKIEPKIEPEANEPIDVKPPPHYEEATSQMKKPQGKSHIKSQIVDDVLEILIKNGELPPSAAQDPATPTTPGTRVMNEGLVYQNSVLIPTPPPLPHTTFAVTLPTSINITSSQSNLNTAQSMQNNISSIDQLNHDHELENRQDALELLLGQQNVDANLDLKALGLDIDALDSMDFGALDCDKLDGEIDMEIGMENGQNQENRTLDSYVNEFVAEQNPNETNTAQDINLSVQPSLLDIMQNNICLTSRYDQSLDNNNICDNGLSSGLSSEFMEIGDVPMEMDEWLDSLIPTSELHDNSTISTPPHQFLLTQHAPISMASQQNEQSTYDPLIGTNNDGYDLFGLDHLNMHSTPLSWDRVDFAA